MHLLTSTNEDSTHNQSVVGMKLPHWQASSGHVEDERDELSTFSKCNVKSKSASPRAVHFSQDRLCSTIMIDEEPEETLMRWYNEADYARFEKDRFLTSFEYKAIRLKTNFNEDEHSIRGLECITDSRLRRRQVSEKKDLATAIKAEEIRQKGDGNFTDMKRIRDVSLRYTRSARDRAISIAAVDAKEIQGKPKSWLGRKKSLFTVPHRSSSL